VDFHSDSTCNPGAKESALGSDAVQTSRAAQSVTIPACRCSQSGSCKWFGMAPIARTSRIAPTNFLPFLQEKTISSGAKKPDLLGQVDRCGFTRAARQRKSRHNR